MGNDGGSIPGRMDLVKERPKERKANVELAARVKSNLCSLSEQPLRRPIVCCRLGNMYNKECILQCLLEKNMPRGFQHIDKLKDVKDAKIETRVLEDNTSTMVCPISQTELNGFHRFTVNWNCGCVIAEKTILQVKGDENKCISCGESYKKEDIISLNQTKEEQESNRSAIMEERKKTKEALRQKKQEKLKAKEDKKAEEAKKKEESGTQVELGKRKAEGSSELELESSLKRMKQEEEAGAHEKEAMKKIVADVSADRTKKSTYTSLFHKSNPRELKKGDDFLSRSRHHGLR